MTRVFVCAGCIGGGKGLLQDLSDAILVEGLRVEVAPIDCMSGCARPATVAVRATNKTAYLFGDLSPTDIPRLIRFLRLYAASSDGNFADARPLGDLRMKAMARIPA
jgi:predicted metal-binding protein